MAGAFVLTSVDISIGFVLFVSSFVLATHDAG